jgi:hypothetical protein
MAKTLGSLLIWLLSVFLTSCAPMPFHSKLSSESFATDTLSAKRVYILASIDSVGANVVATSIVRDLQSRLREKGALVETEIQTLNPVTLGPDIDMSRTRRYAPNAIVLVRIRSSQHFVGMATYQQWAVAFDLLDSTLRGVWRASTKILRIDKIEENAAAIAQEALDDLQTNNVLKITEDDK